MRTPPIVADEHHLGFSLDRTGDGVYLYNTVASGQTLLDSVEFGQQIPDVSIGRMGADRQWTLTQPTFGARKHRPVDRQRQHTEDQRMVCQRRHSI